MECGLFDVFRDNHHFKTRNSYCVNLRSSGRGGGCQLVEGRAEAPVRRPFPSEVSPRESLGVGLIVTGRMFAFVENIGLETCLV